MVEYKDEGPSSCLPYFTRTCREGCLRVVGVFM